MTCAVPGSSQCPLRSCDNVAFLRLSEDLETSRVFVQLEEDLEFNGVNFDPLAYLRREARGGTPRLQELCLRQRKVLRRV